MKASERLRKLVKEVEVMELQCEVSDAQKQETVQRYYYGKGSLDFRDKMIKVISDMRRDSSATEVLELLLLTFPDPYPGK